MLLVANKVARNANTLVEEIMVFYGAWVQVILMDKTTGSFQLIQLIECD